MKKKELVREIKNLLKDQTDLIVEIRSMNSWSIEMDLASDKWIHEVIPDRVVYCLHKLIANPFFKDKALAICPVGINEYLNMKKREMNK